MSNKTWIIIATDPDTRRLVIDADKLRLCYPGKYDIRITQMDRDAPFALAVRHRE